ncbi:MAG: hypothetical protein IAF94_21715 [Pirellulaceae bacterium]|nr:hypothetical protein [Pirellulaceae bacterium]
MLRASGPPPSRLFWRRVFVAPVCLCAVAALHFYRVSACGQTPWKGGGFGMFSTANSEDSRFLRCRKAEVGCMSASEMHAQCGPESPIVIPRHLSREELRARVAPTPQRLARLAGLLSQSEQAPVVVEVWHYRFDANTSKLLAFPASGLRKLAGESPRSTRGTP